MLPILTKGAAVSESFWSHFRDDLLPCLKYRTETFPKIFEYLDTLNRPVVILETGCMRELGAWGDGQSTFLFDLYAQGNPGSRVYSVDKDNAAVAIATKYTSNCTTVTTGDSVIYLNNFNQAPDLVYLDSFDLNLRWPLPAATHTFKELTAIMSKLAKDSLVVVDDALLEVSGVEDERMFKALLKRIGGKARFVAEYAEDVGVEPLFTGYQCGWVNLARRA